MIHEQLWLELDKVAGRYRNVRFWGAMAVGWSVAAIGILLLKMFGGMRVPEWSAMGSLFGGMALTLIIVAAYVSKGLTPKHEWIARQIEAAFPDLKSGLLAAIEQRPELPDGRFGFLQESVLREALHHAASHSWGSVVSSRRVAMAVSSHLIAMSLFAFVVLNNLSWMPHTMTAGLPPTNAEAKPDTTNFSVVVEPGDTEIERGTSLLVLARVSGEMPADATLIMTSNGSEPSSSSMPRSLADPVFGGRVAIVKEPFDYRVELGGQVSKTYHVGVFEYPRLERADARLKYPSYTGLEERLVQDVRSVSVVEGTQVTLTCTLNKQVKSAMLIPVADASSVRLNGSTAGIDARSVGYVYEATLTADKSRKFKLELIDEADRHNVEQFDFAINVIPNQPPTLKLVQPAKDLEVSPLEELDLKATAWDDFGLKRMGLSFAIAGQAPVDVVLGENAVAKQKHELANAIKFEELKAEPDQLLSYHFWAEDFGPDGNLRRTSSDMYFAEVRHFEEIFRQGQPPPGGQQQQQQQNSQAGQQAQQLAQSQKEIINATWKLIRREIGSQTTKPFAEDVEQLVQSQNALLEKAKALAEKVTDEQSQTHVMAVIEAMLEAVKQQMAAHEQSSSEPLSPALTAEQSAYQALLKLRAREHEVVRQQQQQQSSSSQSQQADARSAQQRQQMEQLDLKDEKNRYETQRQAQAQQESAEDRETRQVLNRLKELARRQHDLNERLKDLQTALQEAQTEERKEEIKQQLKRLQDEQRQVLRDTDELQSRMESPQNQEKMSNERQQLEETRDQVRRASESLEKVQVTQAAAAGTRAEKDFEELRNEFRRRASNRFNEEMRDLRESARDLEREQKDLSQRLTEVTQPEKRNSVEGAAPAEPRSAEKDDSAKKDSAGDSPSRTAPSRNSAAESKRTAKSLREDPREEELIKGLSEQKQKLSNLNERMKQTIQEAEETEPLLTERLYDAARNLQESKADRALDAASRSLQRGLMEDAQQVEQIAGRGISQLRDGVEKAAEAVLGDETEALRRAREQLQELSKELNREIARNAPNEASRLKGEVQGGRGEEVKNDAVKENTEGQTANSESPDRKPQVGQSQSSKPPTGNQPSEKQTNERQPSGNQTPEKQAAEEKSQNGQPPQQSGQRPRQQPGGEQPGQANGTQPSEGQADTGRQSQSGPPRGQRGPQRLTGSNQSGQSEQPNGGTNREAAPISGEDFREWSDRLRDVEEMVDSPDLRAEAARIRDQARAIRAEMKRHSKEPNWNVVRINVAEPLAELTNRVAEELLRRNSKQAIVPLDRDPVPPKYSEKTRRYYERLGSGR